MPNYNYSGNGGVNNSFMPSYYNNGNENRYQYPSQFPAYNSYMANNLSANSPYNNYMGINNNGYQNPSTQRVTNYLKCRPVSSQEEARACQIDLDGSLWVFTDVGNKKIYTKQVDANGLATFNIYNLDAATAAKANEQFQRQQIIPQYITKEQFDKTVLTLATAIKELQNGNKQQNEAASPQETLLDIK